MATSNTQAPIAPTGERLPADHELIAPRPNPVMGSLCKCGKSASIVLQGSWFPDGQSRAYCLQCHAHGSWRLHAAMILQEEKESRNRAATREVLRTLGAVLMTITAVWALAWIGGSDHPSAAGEPSLWHWCGIVPLGALGWLLVHRNSDEVAG